MTTNDTTPATPSKEAMDAAKEIQAIPGLCAYFEPASGGIRIEGISQFDLAPIIDRHFAPLRAERDALQAQIEQAHGVITDDTRQIVELRQQLQAASMAVKPLEALLFASENADETGYVTDVGFLPLEDIQADARTALAAYAAAGINTETKQ